MAVPIIMAAGAALQILGNYASNMAQAQQERINAAYYRKQGEFVRLSQMRAERLADFDYTQKIGTQVSAYAGSGVDMSGSAQITVGGTAAQMLDELFAIKKKGDLDYELAMMRGTLSEDRAKVLSSLSYNVVQGATTAINAYAATDGFGRGIAGTGGGGLTYKGTTPLTAPSGTDNFLAGQSLLGVDTSLGGY